MQFSLNSNLWPFGMPFVKIIYFSLLPTRSFFFAFFFFYLFVSFFLLSTLTLHLFFFQNNDFPLYSKLYSAFGSFSFTLCLYRKSSTGTGALQTRTSNYLRFVFRVGGQPYMYGLRVCKKLTCNAITTSTSHVERCKYGCCARNTWWQSVRRSMWGRIFFYQVESRAPYKNRAVCGHLIPVGVIEAAQHAMAAAMFWLGGAPQLPGRHFNVLPEEQRRSPQQAATAKNPTLWSMVEWGEGS